jgi:hypothetical protein
MPNVLGVCASRWYIWNISQLLLEGSQRLARFQIDRLPRGASTRDPFGSAPRRLPCFVDSLVADLFCARPRLAFIAQLFQFVVGQMFDSNQ